MKPPHLTDGVVMAFSHDPTAHPRGLWFHKEGGRPGLRDYPLTVAGQRRTCTGFAFEPYHPGVGHLACLLAGLYAACAGLSRKVGACRF